MSVKYFLPSFSILLLNNFHREHCYSIHSRIHSHLTMKYITAEEAPEVSRRTAAVHETGLADDEDDPFAYLDKDDNELESTEIIVHGGDNDEALQVFSTKVISFVLV